MLKKAAQQGRSKLRGDAYSVRYGEPLSEARTPLADFFSILLGPGFDPGSSSSHTLHWCRTFYTQPTLARIIHERFCCNRRFAAATSLRRAGSPLAPSTYCSSTPRGLAAPHAPLATRLRDFATNRHEYCGLAPLLPCTDLILVEPLIPILPAIVHLKAPAVKPNHQEERQSKDPHLGYELMMALRTFRFFTQQSTHGRRRG